MRSHRRGSVPTVAMVLALVAALTCRPATAAAASPAAPVDLADLPGYIALDQIEVPPDAGDVMVVDLGPVLLQLAARQQRQDDSRLTRLLSRLQSIQLKTFAVDEQQMKGLLPQVRRIEARMERQGWQRLIHAEGEGQTINVSTISRDGRIAGLMIIALQPGEEATFINVAGDLDLADLIDLAAGGDLDVGGMIQQIEKAGQAAGRPER